MAGNKDLGKLIIYNSDSNSTIANERLNEDLDNYFKKNAAEVVNGQAAADKEVAKVAEEKKE